MQQRAKQVNDKLEKEGQASVCVATYESPRATGIMTYGPSWGLNRAAKDVVLACGYPTPSSQNGPGNPVVSKSLGHSPLSPLWSTS